MPSVNNRYKSLKLINDNLYHGDAGIPSESPEEVLSKSIEMRVELTPDTFSTNLFLNTTTL